MTYFKVEE